MLSAAAPDSRGPTVQRKRSELLALMETELRDKLVAPIVRLEAVNGKNPVHRRMLVSELGVGERTDVFESDGMPALRGLMGFRALRQAAVTVQPRTSGAG